MNPALLASLGMLVAFSGLSSLAHAHEGDRHGDARQRSAHHRLESLQQPASGDAAGMLAVALKLSAPAATVAAPTRASPNPIGRESLVATARRGV